MLFDDPNKLSNEEIRKKLTESKYSTELIDEIIQIFWFHDWGNSFISFKPHFQVLQEYLAKTKHFSRFDFYQYFYQQTISDYEKIKDSLQKLALVFELMQTDRLSVDEFSAVLNKIKAPEELAIESLTNCNLISNTKEEGKQIIKWTHHSLTEYPAAEYILNQKDPISTAKKFMIYTDDITSYKSSWAGTLRFLLEKDPETFVPWIIDFIKKNPDSFDDGLAETLVFATSDKITPKLKTALFDLVFGTYQEKKFWIPVWARHYLYKFIDNKIYQELKNNKNDNYVVKGNIVATIDGMLQHQELPSKEKNFWKEKFIKCANEKIDNGVLQRHSLAALENFKGDVEIIKKVAKNNAESSDSLVRQAFISLCEAIDPNASESIHYFTQAILNDTAHIYARNALYNITTKSGIKELLTAFADSPKLMHEFLDKESIFNSKDKKSDNALIDHIRQVMDKSIGELIKKIIFSTFTGKGNYNTGDSYFLQQLALLLQSAEPNYLHELVKLIQSLTPEQKTTLFINDIEGIIAILLKPSDLEKFQKIFVDDLHQHAGYALAAAVRMAVSAGNPRGEAVLKKGIELKITADPTKQSAQNNYQKQQEEKIYEQFKKYLNPSNDDTYYPQVFRYFSEEKDTIRRYWNENTEKVRLLRLAIKSNLEKIETEKIKIQYKDASKTGEYTISSVGTYFADILQVIYILQPDTFKKKENRQKAINFIPFAYGNDTKIILDIVGKVTDKELKTVNSIMLSSNNDARYLIPQSYIYFVREQTHLKSVKDVLTSLAKDRLISDSDRTYALKTLESFISASDKTDKNFLTILWNPKQRNPISDAANALLISVFHDEKAIAWRIKILKDSAAPFKRQEGGHSVGPLELELDNLAFAKPLIELNDEKYLYNYINLLDFSLTIIDKPDYWEYVNYLWRIAISFVIHDGVLLSQKSLQQLKDWSKKHNNIANINWFNKRLNASIANMPQEGKKISLENALNQIK